MKPDLHQSAARLLDAAATISVLVVGDVMLDKYISGSAARISPEAPVPVVAVKQRRYVPGGAANVAANIAALNATVSLAGVTGPDDSGCQLRAGLAKARIGCEPLIQDASRVTTVKTRVTVGGQQIVRFDDEDTAPVHGEALDQLRAGCLAALAAANVCVVSDYAKGVIAPDFCQWLITAARERGLPVVVDPKSSDLARYRGAMVITPNLKETAAATGERLQNLGLHAAVESLLPAIAPSSLLVTRGEEGMSLFEPGCEEWHLPAMVNEVADVTGAGDTVVGVLAVALGAGFNLREAAALANLAAGVAVGHHGTWAVSATELHEAASRTQA